VDLAVELSSFALWNSVAELIEIIVVHVTADYGSIPDFKACVRDLDERSTLFISHRSRLDAF
jgi:hypothetical protein